MNTFPPESIDIVMFSHPYWSLRDYHIKGKNPGDVIKIMEELNKRFMQIS